MKEFPKDIRFKYTWRKYQNRVLNELEQHLKDNHLHVIAPPGSGKTVLGLQVMLQLNKPTLVLAPTVAIRNQWIQRFCELFLQIEHRPDWISRDIKNPKFLTFSTYQGLHAFASTSKIDQEDPEEENVLEEENEINPSSLELLINSLKDQKIGTVIVDEAHHLKNAWWQTLTKIKESLQPTIVGLTATPPYDVSYQEWQRYTELNGPIDTEISVPELIREGDLCPHQDYIHFSQPTDSELEKIKSHRERIEHVFENLVTDEKLFEFLINIPAIKNPISQHEWIYSNMEIYTSILVFLTHNHAELSSYHFKLTGNKRAQLPKANVQWIEVLINYFLNDYNSSENDSEEYKEELLTFLRKNGALEKNRVVLTSDRKIESYLKSSLGKLESILSISKFEFENLEGKLRQVILGDYIRKEFLNGDVEINKIGVIPIFESLRRKLSSNVQLGVLTGSLIIIPQSALAQFKQIALSYGIAEVRTSALEYDANYVEIKVNEQLKHDLVHIVTQVFESGGFQILVGTKSLLGEGWDAPSINSLILASFVGSFVLSNQMRGRAIRTVKSDKDKTGNIWHLACNDPTRTDGGNDLEILERRFKGFVGISERENKTIENGLFRMVIPKKLNTSSIELINSKTMKSASERDLLQKQWYEAIENGTVLTEEIKIPFEKDDKPYQEKKRLYLKATIGYLLAELASGFMIYAENFVDFIDNFAGVETSNDLMIIIALFGIGGVLFFGRKLFKSVKLYLKYRDISKDIGNIGEALMKTMIENKILHTSADKLEVKTTVNDYGEIFCHLDGGTTFEKSTFIKSLEEIVNPVENPRYLIIRKNEFFKKTQQIDYHQVPEQLGKQKVLAQSLERHWQKLVGSCELVFTRNIKGRSTLLKARFNSLASEFQPKPERTNRWK